MQQATKILSEIKDGKPFEDLAKIMAKVYTCENGGDWDVFISEREVRVQRSENRHFP